MWRIVCRNRHWLVFVGYLMQVFFLTGCDVLPSQTTLGSETSFSDRRATDALIKPSVEAGLLTRDTSLEYQVLKQASGLIKFSHRNFVADIVQLRDQSQRFCMSPSKPLLTQTRMRWARAMNTWSAIKTINFGPINELGLSDRFQFWPDPMNQVEQGFRSRISGDNTELDALSLAEEENSIQGLSALEYLLFDPHVGRLEHYHNQPHLCPLLQNTVHNLLVSSDRLNRAWQGEYARRWLFLEQETLQRAEMRHHLEQMVSGVVMTLADISQQQLAEPLALIDQDPLGRLLVKTGLRELEPQRMESWRSKTSLNHINSSLQFTRKLYEMKHGLGWYLRTLKLNESSSQSSQLERLELDQVIRDQFKRIDAQVSAIDSSAFDLISRNDTEQLESLYHEVAILHYQFGINYVQLAGFNLAPKPELSVRID